MLVQVQVLSPAVFAANAPHGAFVFRRNSSATRVLRGGRMGQPGFTHPISQACPDGLPPIGDVSAGCSAGNLMDNCFGNQGNRVQTQLLVLVTRSRMMKR